MKRLLSLLLAVCLFFCVLFALPAVAEEELPPLYTKMWVNDGQDLLTVELYTDGLRWTAIDFGVQYDPAALSLQSVTVGSKILKAENAGFDFLTMSRDPEESNKTGYCNFVAAVGSSTCRMTAYAGPIAIYTFAVTDLTKAYASLGICVSTLVNADGDPLLDYTAFGPSEPPVAYLTEDATLFRYGDLNRNGVDVFDAMMIMQYVVGSLELNEYQLAAAKVSGGEEVSVFDAMMIMQYVVETISSFPAEQS